MIKLLAVTSKEIISLPLTGLIPIGGLKSSGKSLSTLKESDDYAIVSVSGTEVAIHPLKGKKRGAISLKAGETFAISDLTLAVLEDRGDVLSANQKHSQGSISDDELNELLYQFSLDDDLSQSMNLALEKMIAATGMEKGLLIARNNEGEFDLVARIGVSEKEPWISESLIQQTLKSQKGISIQNIYGSSFQSNQSLMATGFISVQTWPLVVRGETLGIVLVGSLKPHSGFSKDIKSRMAMISSFISLMLWFHRRDMKLKEEVKALKLVQRPLDDSPLLTSDPKLLETVNMAARVSPTVLSVLIYGETGVGKEVLSSWIHQKSERSHKPFVAVNCGAIPADLLESLLFGHKKGAFTGAHTDHIGKFQMADGGTLFLDEIGDLPGSLQVKLLRVLQEKVIEPLGSTKPVKIDVRILAASHRRLSDLVSESKFREDLYFRLAEISLEIPPLRERPGDILLLATSFLKRLAPEKRFSVGAWNWLKAQEWKGNARELLSSVKRAGILAQGIEIQVSDFTKGLPHQLSSNEHSSSQWLGGETLDEAKMKFILEKVKLALSKSGGQKSRAADLLGITPRTLFRYLESDTTTTTGTPV